MSEPRVEEIYKAIPELDAEIRTIEYPDPKNVNAFFHVTYGTYESLGEQGGDIITELYDEKPTEEQIKEDIRAHLESDLSELSNTILSGREEMQLKVLKRLVKNKAIREQG